MKTRITFISDTHTKHNQITNDLPGGDILCHSGDISSMGYRGEIESFCKWFDAIDNYNHKIFIAGNHDWGFQNNHKEAMEEPLEDITDEQDFEKIDYVGMEEKLKVKKHGMESKN